MPEQPPDPIHVLTAARDGIYDIRRKIDVLRPSLAHGGSEAIDAARQELCGALVCRLEIAESEVQQLIDMLQLKERA
jgi:hypothetical protein